MLYFSGSGDLVTPDGESVVLYSVRLQAVYFSITDFPSGIIGWVGQVTCVHCLLETVRGPAVSVMSRQPAAVPAFFFHLLSCLGKLCLRIPQHLILLYSCIMKHYYLQPVICFCLPLLPSYYSSTKRK